MVSRALGYHRKPLSQSCIVDFLMNRSGVIQKKIAGSVRQLLAPERLDGLFRKVFHDTGLLPRFRRGQKPVDLGGLETKLRELHTRDPNRQIMLNTDAKVPYERVRSTLAMVQRVGLRGVSLKVRPKKPDEQ